MNFSRVLFGGASLSVLSMFLALKTSSADEQQKFVPLKIPCTYTIDVDPSKGVKQIDAYVCYGTQVTWVANGHKFHVFFKKGLCPFEDGCRSISDQKPTSSKVKAYAALTVFDYGIVVDDDVFDPHVIGGGGNT